MQVQPQSLIHDVANKSCTWPVWAKVLSGRIFGSHKHQHTQWYHIGLADRCRSVRKAWVEPHGLTWRGPPGSPSAASPPWTAVAQSRHSGAQLSHEPPSVPRSEPATTDLCERHHTGDATCFFAIIKSAVLFCNQGLHLAKLLPAAAVCIGNTASMPCLTKPIQLQAHAMQHRIVYRGTMHDM